MKIDANVLFPFRKRDILLRFHHAGLYRAQWTERILDEWTLNLLEQKPHLEPSVRSQKRCTTGNRLVSALPYDFPGREKFTLIDARATPAPSCSVC